MEEILIAVLCIATIWLALRQAKLSERLSQFDSLDDLLQRLQQRVATLEKSSTSKLESAAATAPSVVAESDLPLVRPSTQKYEDLRAYRVSLPQATSVPAPQAVAEFLRPVAQTPRPEPPPVATPVPEPVRSVSLEERLGQNWLNKLGIVSLVIGIALGLGYQVRHLGPMGKSLLGLALALALLGGGLLLERREQYRIFARAGIGGGWALLFFVSFALYHVDAMRVLNSQGADLVLMLLVAAAIVWHSLRYKSETVTAIAFLLAFLTVGISHVTLFSLVAGAILAAALVLVAARERWFALGLAGLAGAYLNHFLWLTRVLPDGGQPGQPFANFFASAGLLILYWFLFRLLFVLREPLDNRQRLLSSLTAILNSAGLLALLKYQSAYPQWAFYALLALGLAEWVFAFVGRSRWRGSFVVLSSIASVLLLAAIPFRFSGAHWTLIWLLEAEVLFLAGVRMPEVVFRRLGAIAGFLCGLQILAFDLLPLFVAGRDLLPIEIALFSAAALFWANAEFATRLWRQLFADAFDAGAMVATSYLALAMLTLGLWVAIPGSWTVVAWLAAALALGFVARGAASLQLATQADLLAFASLVRIVLVNLGDENHLGALTVRAVTVLIAAALLYCGMARGAASYGLPTEFVPAAYSWPASSLLAILAWQELPPLAIADAWCGLGLVLFETGTFFRRQSLRLQAYALFAASFARVILVNLDLEAGWHPSSYLLATGLPLVAAYLWVYERTRRALAESPLDRLAGVATAWIGLAATVALLYVEVPPNLLADAWAALAMLLVYVAWLLGRSLFTAQSLAVLAAAALRVATFDLFTNPDASASFWHSRPFYVGLACLAMFLSLPAAFGLRRLAKAQSDLPGLVAQPEQTFFFVPLILAAILIAVELHGGNLTIGWIAVGLAAFLFALTVGERSYRLAGLGLLMLGLAKIYAVDVWSAGAVEKAVTLSLTGAALLLVSFLYSRYRDTILKFL
jgi:hypothetical protein